MLISEIRINKARINKARKIDSIEFNILDNLIIYLETMAGVTEKGTFFSFIWQNIVLGSVNIWSCKKVRGENEKDN